MAALIPTPVTLENLIDDDSDINAFNDGVKTQAVSPRTKGAEVVIVQVADDPFVTPLVTSGAATGTSANQLVDSSETFTASMVGAAVYNETDDTWATVTSFVDANTLGLSADIMADTEDYSIRDAVYWEQKFGGGEWKRSGTKTGDNAIVSYTLPVDTNTVTVHGIVYPWELTDIANYPAK